MSGKTQKWWFLWGLMVLLFGLVGVVSAENVTLPKHTTKLVIQEKISEGEPVESDDSICVLKENFQINETDDDVASEFKELALNSGQLSDFEEHLADVFPEFSLVKEASYSYTVNDWVNVYFTLRGGDGNSFFGIIFDRETKAVVHSIAGLFSFNLDQNVQFNFLVDGKTIADMVLSQEGEVISGAVYSLDGKEIDLSELNQNNQSFWGFWDCMTSCLSANAVPLYLVGGLSLVCAGVCVITAGLGCSICIAAALGAWGGVGLGCWVACQ